jgi:tetratricopeptide (TPR) repeat protein
MFEKAIEINPENYSAYHDLGMLYKAKRDYDKAEQMFKKTLEINPGYDWSYIELGWCYAILKNWQKAEGMFKKAIEINSKSDRAYGGLFLCYEVQEKHALANELLKELNALRLEKYNPITRYNYQKLREIVIQRRIKLVCVQYPVRSIQQFKKMLEPYGDIIFVDNEKIFKEALKQGSYDEYFEDSFGGDFGHCTKKGNRLLADNIACVIKENLFNRWP